MTTPPPMLFGWDRKWRAGVQPLAWAAISWALAAGVGVSAQQPGSRTVVQAPPPAVESLNAALTDLSRNPHNVDALLRAGRASLDLGDTQAALGFFRRARETAPGNGEAKAGEASTMLRLGNPVEAVKLFAEAEAAGAPMVRYAGDRGLALDLVGENAAAQNYYRQALAQGYDSDVVRRLALSQAISGDQRGFEATLLPLLQQRDLAAYRTRAFALAIVGKGEEAVSIAQTMLPADVSGRLAPYLRYMPRLTRAQQAAAGNLGEFPPASQIGRDDPKIAALSGQTKAAAAAPQIAPQIARAAPDARLVPSGKPLGRGDKPESSETKAPPRDSRHKAGRFVVTQVPLPQPAPTTAAAVARAEPAPPPPPPVQVAAATQVTPPQPSPEPPAQPVVVARLEPSPPPVQTAEPVPRPSLSIATPAPPPRTTQPKEKVSLAEAFADFTRPASSEIRPAPGAIDIAKLKLANDARKAERKPPAAKPEPKAKAKPKPPANPSRFWIQVGTGRNPNALGFTWRRVSKEYGKVVANREPHTAKWGRTRRLVVGPYKTEDEANEAVRALKKKGLDAFEFTSDEGEEVTPLG